MNPPAFGSVIVVGIVLLGCHRGAQPQSRPAESPPDSAFEGDATRAQPVEAEAEKNAQAPEAHAVALGNDVIVIDGLDDDSVWSRAPAVEWTTDYSGKDTGIKTRVRFAWAPNALYAFWELSEAGFNTDTTHPVDKQRMKLFEEDVAEIFLGSPDFPRDRYYEIEVGPLGHFLDLEVELGKDRWDTDWSSGLRVATKPNKEERRVTIEWALESPDIARLMKSGARLPMGLYRIEGKEDRVFLAWSPTRTEKPNFHVPDAFGTLVLSP